MASRLQAGGTYVDSFRLRSHEVAETACPYKSDVQHETHGGNYPQEVVFRRHATVPRPLWGRPRPWLQPTQTAMLTPASCAERRRVGLVATDALMTSQTPRVRVISPRTEQCPTWEVAQRGWWLLQHWRASVVGRSLVASRVTSQKGRGTSKRSSGTLHLHTRGLHCCFCLSITPSTTHKNWGR